MIERKLMNQNVAVLSAKKKNQNVKSARKDKERHLTKWTWRWMKVHFHYLSYVFDESYLTPKQKVLSAKIGRKIARFAKTREQYRYPIAPTNTRDLGGYKTKDGHTVKTGLILRSDNLSQMQPQGKDLLKEMKVNQILDLRSLRESAFHPDNTRLDIPVIHDPVYTQKGVNRSRNRTFRYGVIYRYHTLFLTNQHAQRAYHNAFKLLLSDHKGATLYHCVEGRDRTGLVSVLLLSALGVNKKMIFKDYLLTDYYAHTKPYYRQKLQLQCFYKAIDNYYGGMRKYLHHIGVSDHDIIKLRKMYLTK